MKERKNKSKSRVKEIPFQPTPSHATVESGKDGTKTLHAALPVDLDIAPDGSVNLQFKLDFDTIKSIVDGMELTNLSDMTAGSNSEHASQSDESMRARAMRKKRMMLRRCQEQQEECSRKPILAFVAGMAILGLVAGGIAGKRMLKCKMNQE